MRTLVPPSSDSQVPSGAPAAIRGNEEVRRAYLGDQHAVTRHG